MCLPRAVVIVAFGSVCSVLFAACPPPPPPPPPPGSSCDARTPAPPAPERVTLQDCASLVDFASLPPPAAAPECPPPAEPVTSLCPDGGAGPGGFVETQEQLEAYQGCTSIDGVLTVAGGCSLRPLSDVQSIAGSFNIGDGGKGGAGALTIVDLDGLQSLRLVEGSFIVAGAPALASLAGLEALEEVTFDFELRFLPSLVRLRGPSALRAIGGEINVSFNDALVYVDGFDALVDLGSPLGRPEGPIRFGYNPALSCVDGFAVLTQVGELEIGNGPLVAVPGLTNAIIAGTPVLKLLDAPSFDLLTLPPLDELRGIVLVRPAETLTDLRAFSGLTSLGALHVFGSALENLGGLDDVVALESLELEQNDALVDISALTSVTQLGAVQFQGEPRFDIGCAFLGASTMERLVHRRTTFEVLPWPATIEHIDVLQIFENESLRDLGETDVAVGDAVIAFNTPLTNDDAAAWLALRDVDGVAKYGGNSDVPLDPCPWIDDGVCDQGMCASDSAADCPPVE